MKLACWCQANTFILRGQIQCFEFIPKTINIIHFHEDHRIVDPVFHVSILEIKANAFRFKVGQIVCQYTFLETEVTIKIPGVLEVRSTNERANGFGVEVNSVPKLAIFSIPGGAAMRQHEDSGVHFRVNNIMLLCSKLLLSLIPLIYPASFLLKLTTRNPRILKS